MESGPSGGDEDDNMSLDNNITDVSARDTNSDEDDYVDDSNSDSDEGINNSEKKLLKL